MAKEDTIKLEGAVEELLPNMTFSRRVAKWIESDCTSLRKNADEKYSRVGRR